MSGVEAELLQVGRRMRHDLRAPHRRIEFARRDMRLCAPRPSAWRYGTLRTPGDPVGVRLGDEYHVVLLRCDAGGGQGAGTAQGKFWWTNRYFTPRPQAGERGSCRRATGAQRGFRGSAVPSGDLRRGRLRGRCRLRCRLCRRRARLARPARRGSCSTAAADHHLERLERRQALGLAGLAARHRSD